MAGRVGWRVLERAWAYPRPVHEAAWSAELGSPEATFDRPGLAGLFLERH